MTHLARRYSALALLAFAGAAAAACGDAAGPTAAPATIAAPSLTIGVGLQEGIESFQVHPGRAKSHVIGDHRISFDADAICDPKLSTYGPGEWDAPCETAKNPVRITATAWRDAEGRPRVDFEPALRFHPDKNVTLYLMDKEAAAEPANFTILWVDPQGALVDEAASDPSVATHVGENGFLYRRVKHFSGYTVSAGRLELDAELTLRAGPRSGSPVVRPGPLQSGHVVATGRLGERRGDRRRVSQP